ncbi:hypothetical protein EYF80_025712 [Liparis tanakae]|uniref:Uncharacterized protein n=1 Tax=Liparis tanakae TaxID=230148 RepID=A0A4Z2HGP7_9TELE|nr:hypothetical protein EYF80_025712 [Liparis tanakae]
MRVYEVSHHDLHISDALERIVHAPVRHLHQNLLDGLAVVLRVHKLSGSKLLRFLELLGVDVHANNPGCPGNLAAHDDGQADSAEAKYGARGTGLDLSVHEREHNPVEMPHPSRHTLSSGAFSFTLAREMSATTVYSEKVLVPMK